VNISQHSRRAEDWPPYQLNRAAIILDGNSQTRFYSRQRMAYILNGIGMTFYGKRDFRGDGSFITTEWVTFLFVPLIPFRSFRVRYQGRGELRYSIGVGSSRGGAARRRPWAGPGSF
jgi:hypothetical protein